MATIVTMGPHRNSKGEWEDLRWMILVSQLMYLRLAKDLVELLDLYKLLGINNFNNIDTKQTSILKVFQIKTISNLNTATRRYSKTCH